MKTLLLADDSVTIQRVIELTFAHEDVRVVSVSDGRRALQWMENEAPDIVLADVEVPDVDGYSLAAHMKQSPRLKNVPVLLLAGAFQPVDQDRVRSVGCEGVLMKPFEPQQLVSRVKGLLEDRAASAAAAAAMPVNFDSPRRTHDGDSATVTPFPGARGAQISHEHAMGDPEPLEPPTRPVWENGAPVAGSGRPHLHEPPVSRVSLVNAFSALLAAEQSGHGAAPIAAAPAPVLSEAMVEEAVRKVVDWMTNGLGFAAAAPAPVLSDAMVEDAVHKVVDRMTDGQGLRAPAPVLSDAMVEDAVHKVVDQMTNGQGLAAPVLSDTQVEDAVRKALEKMTDSLVHRIVSDTAERLIREEIEKIKAHPE